MGEPLQIKTLQRKNTKSLALDVSHNKSPSDLPIPGARTLGIESREDNVVDQLKVGVEFRLDLKPGDLVRLKELGCGSNSVVYKVQHTRTQLIMAKKSIVLENNSAVRRQIVRELKAMHDFNSEYIVKFYGAFQDNNRDVAFCMEFMEAGSLKQTKLDFGPIRQDVLGKIAEAVLGGLIYLYKEHCIMHRDIKPSNILVNAHGQIKLCDFAVSKHMETSIAETFIGTAIYMAPERICGEPYTIKSDIWSVGITLMELAIGKYPFSHPNGFIGLCQSIVKDPSPELPESDVFIPQFRTFMAKCLKKDPKERPTPADLYYRDEYMLAARRTRVNLPEWAAGLVFRRKGEHIGQLTVPINTKSLSTSNDVTGIEPLGGALICAALEPFLQGLHGLTSMSVLEAVKKEKMAGFCRSCLDMLTPDGDFWKSGKIWNEWQAQHERDPLPCPLCLLITDCCVPTSRFQSTSVAPAVLKLGFLNGLMETIIKTGAEFKDEKTSSACAFQMAGAWMTTCLTEHTRCIQSTVKSEPPILPTRVIDVGPPDGSESPRLHLGRKDRGLYFTLSYRWGEGNAALFQTTEANLEAYKTSIPLSALPKTMQDAITIARRFRIRYLWIDALCIVQDSEEDWRAEAKRMASVYKNSLLTIAAAADSTEEGGCFRTRSRRQVRPFPSESYWPDGSTKYIFADRRATRDGARPVSAIDKRAWVLQEQVLSPRVLSYSNNELYWDCISLNASETFPDGIPYFYDADMKLPDVRVLKEAIIGGAKTAISRTRFYSSWRKIVEEYSRRKTSKESDKLVALLGMSKEAAIFLEDDFYLGSWRTTLWKDLLWRVVKPQSLARPQNFVAPTWSWASISDPISFELVGTDTVDTITQCLEIIRVEIGPDQTQADLSGQLTVHGKLVPMPSENTARLNWREDVRGMDSTDLKCLIVAESTYHVYALGLSELANERGYYKRVGTMSWSTVFERFRSETRERKSEGPVLMQTICIR